MNILSKIITKAITKPALRGKVRPLPTGGQRTQMESLGLTKAPEDMPVSSTDMPVSSDVNYTPTRADQGQPMATSDEEGMFNTAQRNRMDLIYGNDIDEPSLIQPLSDAPTRADQGQSMAPQPQRIDVVPPVRTEMDEFVPSAQTESIEYIPASPAKTIMMEKGDSLRYAGPLEVRSLVIPGESSYIKKFGNPSATLKKDNLPENIIKDANNNPIVVYRGMINSEDKEVEGMLSGESRENYASFFTNNPDMAATYAGDEGGFLTPFFVKPKRVIEFPVNEGRHGRLFDKFEFDRRAQNLEKGEILRAHDVVDAGSRHFPNADPLKKWSFGSDVYAIKDTDTLVNVYSKGNVRTEMDALAPSAGGRGGDGDGDGIDFAGQRFSKAPDVDESKDALELADIETVQKGDFKTPRKKDLQKAARQLAEGNITGKQYRQIAKEQSPIEPFTEVPEPATLEKIAAVLKGEGGNGIKKLLNGIIGFNRNIEQGAKVLSRLDIPAYNNFNTWIATVTHKGKSMYGSTAVLKNVEFKPHTTPSLKIAKGEGGKEPFATMSGNWQNMSSGDIRKFVEDNDILEKSLDDANEEWVQVGFNPERHGFFYHKSGKNKGRPIFNADEMIQIGALVLARKPKKPSLTQLEKLKVKGVNAIFNKGGVVDMEEGGQAKADQDYTSEDYSRPPVELFKLPKGYEFG